MACKIFAKFARCKPCAQKVENHLQWLQGARLAYWQILKSSWGWVLINPGAQTKLTPEWGKMLIRLV